MNLTDRRREKEVMDDPGLSPQEHRRALRDLARLNRLSLVAFQVRKELRSRDFLESSQNLRLLDLACGQGDLVRELSRTLPNRVRIDGSDVSPTAVEEARRLRPDDSSSRFFQADVFDGIPPDYDVLLNNLFLHHLSRDEAVAFLQNLARQTARGFVVTDLLRSRIGYLLAFFATRLFCRSPVVHVDSLRSVRAAFTYAELKELALAAGLERFELRRCYPCRLVLSWRKV